MGMWDSLLGTMQSVFHIEGPLGPGIARATNDLAIKNAANNALANLQVARASAATHATSYDDLKERIYLIEFSFDGGTPPAGGANTGKYGFCHTSGGVFNAGQIYLDSGTALVAATVYKAHFLATTSVVTGTVSLIANGIYVATTSSAPFGWTLKGDGTASSTGLIKLIKIPITTTGAASTTATVTNGRVMRVIATVATPYSAGATITTAIGAQTIQATSDVEATVAGSYISEVMADITAGAVVTVTIAGSPAGGAGEVLVEYCDTPLA